MLDIFQYDFMIRAFAAGILIAIIAPIIGIFLVVRRYSLMADTLAHVSLVGVAVGILLNISPLLTAVVAAMVASLGIERLRNTKKIFGESVLALFLSGSLAVAVVLISMARGFNVNIYGYLFGSITTVTLTDLWVILGLGALTLFLIVFLYKEYFFISFDEELAEASGVPVRELNILLILLAAVAVSLSITTVGALLIGALMVIPVITAMRFGKSFFRTLLLSVAFSLLSVTLGLFLSYYFDLASGGAIVVVALGVFLLSLLF